LDALYKNTPFSMRPSIHEVDLGMYLVLWVKCFAVYVYYVNYELREKMWPSK
jgi:hypothetical protein